MGPPAECPKVVQDPQAMVNSLKLLEAGVTCARVSFNYREDLVGGGIP